MSGVFTRNFFLNDGSISNCFPGVHKHGIHTYTQTHTHMTIAFGEMQRIAFRLKSKHIAMICPLMDLNAVLMSGTRFILDTYIYFRYPYITITQTNIYSQLARISFLCTMFFVFIYYITVLLDIKAPQHA